MVYQRAIPTIEQTRLKWKNSGAPGEESPEGCLQMERDLKARAERGKALE